MANGKPGRPRGAPRLKGSVKVQVPFTPSDHGLCRQAAEARYMDVRQWLRELAMRELDRVGLKKPVGKTLLEVFDGELTEGGDGDAMGTDGQAGTVHA